MHTALRLGVRVARLIRSLNPECQICFYGLYASLNAEYLLAHVADWVIGGEYEAPLVSLIEALDRQDSSDSPPDTVPFTPALQIQGVSRRGRIVQPILRRPPRRMPVPSRAELPALDRYARLECDGAQRPAGYVEASRGCLHHCQHCPIVPVYEGRFFVFPAETVLEDIRRQARAGVAHLTFGDPDFLNGPGHSLSIVRAMHAEFPHLTFDFTTKIEHILKHRTLLPELTALGCLFVVSAVESFSDRVLAVLEKGHTRADVVTALSIVRQAGTTLRPSFVAFTPWTSLTDYLEMFDLVEAHDLIDAVDPVQFAVRLLIPPGSALLKLPEVHRFLGPLDQEAFQYQWAHPDPRMDRLHQTVTATVDRAASAGEDVAETFSRLRALAWAAADREPPPPLARRSSERPRAPRLTEPWFCCAEPTEGQFRLFQTHGHDGA
jgi:radical SAM superfamily enzyme YgiQ (UPF0313 family)